MTSDSKSLPIVALTGPVVLQGEKTYATVLQGAGGEQVKALVRGSDERAVCAALYAAPPYDLHVPAMAVSRLSLNLTPARVVGGMDGERARTYEAQRYSLFMAPAGAEMNWRKEAPSRHITLYFRPDVFESGDDMDTPLARPEALHNFSVPGLRALANQVFDELRHGGPNNRDATDCLARLMLIQVSRHLCKVADEARSLCSMSMARLHDYVMAHLSEQILVADLARHLSIPVNRFAWEYKAHTGQSPHQFVMALRLQHAGHLLRTSSVSVADVAVACGFSSQQHLTNAMRRHVGVTPARYRLAAGRGRAGARRLSMPDPTRTNED